MTDLRGLAYGAIVRSPGADPEAIVDACKVVVLAIRHPKFGEYDDELHLITPAAEHSFRGNTDPSRTGWNKGVGKFYAQLTPGVWPFRTGEHRQRPGNARQLTAREAQRAQLERFFTDGRARGEFAVKRVEKNLSGKVETGYFAINLHSGAERSTSSWGCITAHPDQWAVFQPLLYAELARHGQVWPAGWFPIVVVEAA